MLLVNYQKYELRNWPIIWVLNTAWCELTCNRTYSDQFTYNFNLNAKTKQYKAGHIVYVLQERETSKVFQHPRHHLVFTFGCLNVHNTLHRKSLIFFKVKVLVNIKSQVLLQLVSFAPNLNLNFDCGTGGLLTCVT